jgi:hypothetical protein
MLIVTRYARSNSISYRHTQFSLPAAARDTNGNPISLRCTALRLVRRKRLVPSHSSSRRTCRLSAPWVTLSLFRRAGEAAEAGGRLEGLDRIQRR